MFCLSANLGRVSQPKHRQPYNVKRGNLLEAVPLHPNGITKSNPAAAPNNEWLTDITIGRLRRRKNLYRADF